MMIPDRNEICCTITFGLKCENLTSVPCSWQYLSAIYFYFSIFFFHRPAFPNNDNDYFEPQLGTASDWNKSCTPWQTDQWFFWAVNKGHDPRNGICKLVTPSAYSSIYLRVKDYENKMHADIKYTEWETVAAASISTLSGTKCCSRFANYHLMHCSSLEYDAV